MLSIKWERVHYSFYKNILHWTLLGSDFKLYKRLVLLQAQVFPIEVRSSLQYSNSWQRKQVFQYYSVLFHTQENALTVSCSKLDTTLYKSMLVGCTWLFQGLPDWSVKYWSSWSKFSIFWTHCTLKSTGLMIFYFESNLVLLTCCYSIFSVCDVFLVSEEDAGMDWKESEKISLNSAIVATAMHKPFWRQ